MTKGICCCNVRFSHHLCHCPQADRLQAQAQYNFGTLSWNESCVLKHWKDAAEKMPGSGLVCCTGMLSQGLSAASLCQSDLPCRSSVASPEGNKKVRVD
jgi:hypothetical protein